MRNHRQNAAVSQKADTRQNRESCESRPEHRADICRRSIMTTGAAILFLGAAVAAALLWQSGAAPEHKSGPGDIDLPTHSRDLGFMSRERLSQIDKLLDLQREFEQLPRTHCAVCMVLGMEVVSSAIRLAVVSRSPHMAGAALVCESVARQGMLGVTPRRQQWLMAACRELLTARREAQLAAMAADLASAVGRGEADALQAMPHLEAVCGDVCPRERTGALQRWGAILEAFLGAEPIGEKPNP